MMFPFKPPYIGGFSIAVFNNQRVTWFFVVPQNLVIKQTVCWRHTFFFFTPYHFLIFDMRFWYWTWTKLLAKGQMLNHKLYVESHCSLVQRVSSRCGGTFEVIMRWYNVGFTYVLDSLNQLFKALLYDRSWIRPPNSWDHRVYLRIWSHWKRTTNENPIYTRW